MIRTILEKDGYTVLESGGGEEAVMVSRMHPHPIELAVIDVNMPGMGGMDLANCLLPQRPTMKVLYISGMVDSVAVTSLATAAPELVVRKPFTSADLTARVRAILL
jgi:DNA-binding response OmpR family regulator